VAGACVVGGALGAFSVVVAAELVGVELGVGVALVVALVVAVGSESLEPVSRVGRGVVTSHDRVPDSLCLRCTFNAPADVGTVTVTAFGPSATAVVVCVGPVMDTATFGRASRKLGVSALLETNKDSPEVHASSLAAESV
jgi:hypothetical protein